GPRAKDVLSESGALHRVAACICTVPDHPRAGRAHRAVAHPRPGAVRVATWFVSNREPRMADPHSVPSAGRFEVRVTSDSHFSWIRTRLSLERTMMSWIRTAVSLIGFGFAIVQFFERLQQMPGVRPA